LCCLECAGDTGRRCSRRRSVLREERRATTASLVRPPAEASDVGGDQKVSACLNCRSHGGCWKTRREKQEETTAMGKREL